MGDRGGEVRLIPAHIRRTIVSCLRARAQMAQMFADLPLAQRHIAEVEDAMRWLEGQEVEVGASDEKQPISLHVA